MSELGTGQAAVTPRREASTLTINANLVAVVLAALFTVVGIKLTSFLPAKYYFSFSKLVDTTNNTTNPFLISNPPYLSADDVCQVLDADKKLPSRYKCEGEGSASQVDDEDKPQNSSGVAKEDRLAEQAVRVAAQSQSSLENIIGFALRLCIPLFAGFIIARLFGPSNEVAAGFGAAAGAIILCWPVIVLWDLVVAKGFKDLYGQFLFLYVLSAVCFFYMAKIGAIFGGIAGEAAFAGLSPLKIIQDTISKLLSKLLEPGLVALLTALGMKFMQNLIASS